MNAADRSARLSLGFSSVGHMYSHLFAPIFFVVALTLETEWSLTHGEAITLVVLGNVLFGVAAPVAGWLGDRWRVTAMISLFFLGTGGGMILTGLTETPNQMMLALAVTGLCASIYHPVGIAWLVRNAASRGLALGVNGVFGGIGPAVAALTAGLLTDLAGWRWAFIVPGVLIIATGIAFQVLVARRIIVETTVDRRRDAPASREDTRRAFMVLAVTLLCTGLIYQATQAGLPKVFSEGLGDILSEGVLGVSALVAFVYLMAGGLQVVAGHLADRFPLRSVYMICFALQVPFLMLAGAIGGLGLVADAAIMVSINVGALPAENSLVARYAPANWRGLAFGLKFILAFGISGLGIKMNGVIYDATGGFLWVFVVLAAIAAVGFAATLLLPAEHRRAAVIVEPVSAIPSSAGVPPAAR